MPTPVALQCHMCVAALCMLILPHGPQARVRMKPEAYEWHKFQCPTDKKVGKAVASMTREPRDGLTWLTLMD